MNMMSLLALLGVDEHVELQAGDIDEVDACEVWDRSLDVLDVRQLSSNLGGVPNECQRKTKGQQLKGKIVAALFHTFWHFSTLFHTFSEFFRILSPGLFLRIKGGLLLF